MSVTTPELILTRREEIINACEELYQSMSFKEITIQKSARAYAATRFLRGSAVGCSSILLIVFMAYRPPFAYHNTIVLT